MAELEARATEADARDARARDELSALRETAAGNDAARKELQSLAAAATRTVYNRRRANAMAQPTDLSDEAQNVLGLVPTIPRTGGRAPGAGGRARGVRAFRPVPACTERGGRRSPGRRARRAVQIASGEPPQVALNY